MFDKAKLVAAIVAFLQTEYEVLHRAAQATYEAATHEENKAENKYDTRGLEASYLAESQSKRAQELKQTVGMFKNLKLRNFNNEGPITLGALVELTRAEDVHYYFIGPKGGGTRIEFEDKQVLIITAASPLGSSLLKGEIGDDISIGIEPNRQTFEITAIY